ncbi:MAG: hypothetical protein K2Q01_02275 [Rickettsiales bacterium]|nr:hypothetical protein [Rickettsiales bacterium]
MKTPNYSGDPRDPTDDTPFDAFDVQSKSASTVGSLKNNSLKAAGYAYLVGDAALFASGYMGGRSKEAMSGLVYTIGGAACAKFANPKAEKQLQLLGARLGEHLREVHVPIPDQPDLQELTKKGGLIDHAEAFLYKYPSQVLNATYAVGGAQLLRSGLQHGKHWDTASGALVAAGGLAGLLIKEKAPDADHPPKTAFAKAVSWFQEKPLRLSGGLYALNNVTLIMSALEERKAKPANHSYMFKFLTAASYIFGNTMLALSSKDNSGKKEDCDAALEKLADASARIIAAQHKEVREALTQDIATYLAAQPEVTMKAPEIVDMLHKRLKPMNRVVASSWMGKLVAVPQEPNYTGL